MLFMPLSANLVLNIKAKPDLIRQLLWSLFLYKNGIQIGTKEIETKGCLDFDSFG